MSNQSSPKNGIEQRKKLSKGDTPFYEAPLGVALSSQIIKEAREKLHDAKKNIKPITDASRGVRTLGSNRPFTPREEKRSLFGPKSTRPVNERPPSSFSIGSKSFDADTSSRPLSATRLSPIDKVILTFSSCFTLKKIYFNSNFSPRILNFHQVVWLAYRVKI